MERLELARYVVIAGALIVCFNNLIDEISNGAGLLRVAFFSGLLLLFAIILVFSENKYVLAGILGIAGLIMMISIRRPNEIMAGMIFVGYATYEINNKYFNFAVYAIVAMIIVVLHVVSGLDPENIINILVGHAVIFSLNELIYRQGHKKDGIGG